MCLWRIGDWQAWNVVIITSNSFVYGMLGFSITFAAYYVAQWYFPRCLVIQLLKKLEHEVPIVFLEWKICIHSQFILQFFLVGWGGRRRGKGKQERIERISDLTRIHLWSYLFLTILGFLKLFFLWQAVDISQLWRSLICSSQRLMVNLKVKVKINWIKWTFIVQEVTLLVSMDTNSSC